MTKDDLKKRISQAESPPSSYNTLNSVSKTIQTLAIFVAIIGVIIGLLTLKASKITSLATIVEFAVSAALIYAVSAIISAIADIVLNTYTTKRLLELQIQLDNDYGLMKRGYNHGFY